MDATAAGRGKGAPRRPRSVQHRRRHRFGLRRRVPRELPRVALVGSPNVGKSVIFHHLTGLYATVSNYPGTTVQLTRGTGHLGGTLVEVIDTPGVASLSALSEDARVARDVLITEELAAIVQIADAKNLQRSLLLTVQLAELGLPMVVDLNMADEAAARGITVDWRALAEELGVPFVETVATAGHGIGALREAIGRPRVARLRVTYDAPVEKAIGLLEPLMPPCPASKRALALMVLCREPGMLDWLGKRLAPDEMRRVDNIIRACEDNFDLPLFLVVQRRRREVVDRLLRRAVRHQPKAERGVYPPSRVALALTAIAVSLALLVGYGGEGPLWATLGRYLLAILGGWELAGAALAHAEEKISLRLTNPLFGLAAGAVVLYVVYRFVGVLGAGTLVDFFESVIFGQYINPAAEHLCGPVLGMRQGGLLYDFFVGEYGMITMGLTYAFAIVFPIVTTFFIAFGILEDSGYLPRLAALANRLFSRVGLSGQAILPMVLGLGCGTMAVLTTRILETRRERIIATLLLGLGVPCSAQLAIIVAVTASLGWKVLLLTVGAIVFHLALVGYLAARVLPGEKPDFIVELPPMRMPVLGNVLRKTWMRVRWYVTEAVPLFLLGTFILFVLDRADLLGVLARWSEPVISGLLGLPRQTAMAFIMGFVRRDYAVVMLREATIAGGGPLPELTPVQVVVAVVTVVLFVPCVASVFIIIRERGLRVAAAIVGFVIAYAFAAGGALNYLLRALHVFQ